MKALTKICLLTIGSLALTKAFYYSAETEKPWLDFGMGVYFIGLALII